MRFNFRKRTRKLKGSEQGQAAVIAALAMVGLMGMTALAIDGGSWMQTQRHYQNAADAAALSACDVAYLNTSPYDAGSPEAKNRARESAYLSADMNDLSLDRSDTDQMKVDFDDANQKVVVTITKPTDNYFSQTLTGKDQTTIKSSSTAQITVSGNPGARYHQDAAVEGRNGIDWQGQAGLTVKGGMETGGDLNIHSGAEFNGTLLANGHVLMDDSVNAIVDGDVFSGSWTKLTETGGTYKGNIYSKGDVTFGSTGTKVGQGVHSNGSITLNRTTVDGDVEAKGSISRTDTGSVVSGSVRTNNSSVSTDGISVTGDVITNAGLDDVPFVPYTWKWDQLKSDIENKENGVTYTKVNSDLVKEYKEKYPDQQYNFNFDGKNIEFYSTADPQQFIDFCKDPGNGGDGSDHPIYFPGNLQIDGDANLKGGVIVEKSITINKKLECSSDKMALISMDGDIDLQGGVGTVTGMIMTLGDSNGNIKINNGGNGGTVTGGVVAHNNLTMTASWDIEASTSWEDVIVPGTPVTKHVHLVK